MMSSFPAHLIAFKSRLGGPGAYGVDEDIAAHSTDAGANTTIVVTSNLSHADSSFMNAPVSQSSAISGTTAHLAPVPAFPGEQEFDYEYREHDDIDKLTSNRDDLLIFDHQTANISCPLDSGSMGPWAFNEGSMDFVVDNMMNMFIGEDELVL